MSTVIGEQIVKDGSTVTNVTVIDTTVQADPPADNKTKEEVHFSTDRSSSVVAMNQKRAKLAAAEQVKKQDPVPLQNPDTQHYMKSHQNWHVWYKYIQQKRMDETLTSPAQCVKHAMDLIEKGEWKDLQFKYDFQTNSYLPPTIAETAFRLCYGWDGQRHIADIITVKGRDYCSYGSWDVVPVGLAMVTQTILRDNFATPDGNRGIAIRPVPTNELDALFIYDSLTRQQTDKKEEQPAVNPFTLAVNVWLKAKEAAEREAFEKARADLYKADAKAEEERLAKKRALKKKKKRAAAKAAAKEDEWDEMPDLVDEIKPPETESTVTVKNTTGEMSQAGSQVPKVLENLKEPAVLDGSVPSLSAPSSDGSVAVGVQPGDPVPTTSAPGQASWSVEGGVNYTPELFYN